jgi:acetylglutamate kinase
MTDVDGVLKKEKLIAQLTASEAEKLIRQKVISGGMEPKIEAGIFCVNNGVESAQIINGTDSHSVIAELFTDKGIGTKIVL